MSADLTRRHIVDRRRGLFGWAFGLACYAALIISFFPTIRDSPSFSAALDDYPEELMELFGGDVGFDLTSGPGFLGAELYYLILPLLLAVVAIGIGASLGSDQESGLMDLLLAYPIRRRRVVLERALALVIVVSFLTAVVALVVAIAGGIVDLGVGATGLAATSAASILLAVLHGFVALAAAAVSGRRSAAVGVATVVFAAGYLLNVAAGFINWLEPARVLSPYFHATGSSPLVSGWPLGNLAALVAVALTVLGVAVVAFDRRDLI